MPSATSLKDIGENLPPRSEDRWSTMPPNGLGPCTTPNGQRVRRHPGAVSAPPIPFGHACGNQRTAHRGDTSRVIQPAIGEPGGGGALVVLLQRRSWPKVMRVEATGQGFLLGAVWNPSRRDLRAGPNRPAGGFGQNSIDDEGRERSRRNDPLGKTVSRAPVGGAFRCTPTSASSA